MVIIVLMDYYLPLNWNEILTHATRFILLVTRAQIVLDMRHPEVVKFIEAESEMVSARVWEEEGTGNKCLVGTQFQFGKMRHFRRWMAVMVVQQ